MEVYDALARARAGGLPVVLVTVLEADEGAPTHPGAKLVVAADSRVLAGTLGCSEFDGAGVRLALEAHREGTPVRSREVLGTAGAEHSLELFAELHAPEPAIVVLGANAVGRALVQLARTVGRRALLVAPGGDTAVPPGVEVKADDPVRFLLAAAPGERDAVVVTDHDAPWVDEVLRVALASDAFYVGMLGSARHAPSAVRRLREAGVPEEHIARLRSPVGLDIGSRSAEEIALSIAAEILAVERGRAGGPMGVDWTERTP